MSKTEPSPFAPTPLRESRVWHCRICNHYYDLQKGIPSLNIPAGTLWEDVPENFLCPGCGFEKDMYVIKDINTAHSRYLR